MPDKDTRSMTDNELVSLAGRAQKINEAPVEAMLRLKRQLEKLEKNSERFEKAQLSLAIVMLLVATMQIILAFFSLYKELGLIIVIAETILTIIVIFYLLKNIIEELTKSQNKN